MRHLSESHHLLSEEQDSSRTKNGSGDLGRLSVRKVEEIHTVLRTSTIEFDGTLQLDLLAHIGRLYGL